MTNSSLINSPDGDNDLDYVNLNMRQAVLPVTVLVGIENIVGLIGNILILLVYSKRSEKSNFRYFVIFMAWIDLTSCLTCVPGEVFSQLNWYKYEHWEWICKVKSFFNVVGAWGSASILLLLAFDRQRKICRPLAWQIQPSLALKLCSIAVLVSIVVAAPIIVFWGKQTYLYQIDNINVNVSVCEKSSEFSENTYYPFVYITSVYVPVGFMMIVITILNVLTAKKLFCDTNELLAETWSASTLGRGQVKTNNSSTTSLNTISERLSTQEVSHEHDIGMRNDIPCAHANSEAIIEDQLRVINDSETNAWSGDEVIHDSSKDKHSCNGKVITRQLSTELTEFNDGSRTTSVTLFTLNDIASPSKQSNTVNNNQSQSNETQERQIPVENSKDVIQSTVAPRNVVRGASLTLFRTTTGTGRKAGPDIRFKRKTIIMLVLTTVFVITLSIYIILISVVAEQNILQTISNSEKAVYFLFLRLYFVNCVLNPLLYGFLDPRFCNGIKRLVCRKSVCN